MIARRVREVPMREQVSKEILRIALAREIGGQSDNLRLWKAALSGDDESRTAVNEMLCGNLITVVRVAEEFGGSGPLSVDDLVSEGVLLLVGKYIPKYNPDRSSFRNFITQALRRDFVKIVSRDGNPGLKMPVGRLTKIAKLRRQGDVEAAESLQKAGSVTSLDVDSGGTASQEKKPEEAAERREALYSLRLAMATLTDRERDIVRARFAIPPFDRSQTLVEIGKRWGIHKERVRQIESAVLAKLRDALITLE